MGLVKAAFLWELLTAGFSVLISDLDVLQSRARSQSHTRIAHRRYA